MSELAGKIVGLCFLVQWFGECRDFVEMLAEIYNELLTKGEPFEIVFVGGDTDEGTSFNCHLNIMPKVANSLNNLYADR